MMPGMIMLWAGSIADIPSGWAFCDGTQGTPDLRNRFIAQAQEDVAGVPKAVLTSFLTEKWDPNLHLHAFTGDGHSHDMASGDEIDFDPPNGHIDHHTSVAAATGDTNNQYSTPKAYVLCYIMKL